MAKQIESLQVRLEVAGGEQLSKLKSSFRALETTLGQSETGLRRARATLLDYGRGAQQSEALFRGMITALEGVRGQVEVNSSAFGELTQDIKGYSDALRGSTDAQERQRASLLAMGSGARRSAGDLREVITGLQTLRGEVRPGSSAFVQLGRDVATLQARLRGLTEESRAYRSVLGQALSAKPDVLARQLESFRRVLADTASSAEQLANAMRSIELLSVGAGRTGAVQREQIFSSAEGLRFFAQLRRSYEDLPKTAAVISQRIAEVNTELENTTSYETRRRLTQELIQLNRELKNTVVEITTAENMAAMALRQRMAARRAVSGGEGGFGAFSQEVTRRTAAGRYSRSGQDIVAYRQNEEAIKAAMTGVEQAYNATEKAIQNSLNRRTDLEIKAQQEVDARLDAISERRLREMREEDAAYERSWMRRLEAADRYANSKAFSKQFLGLQGQELSPFYSRVVELGVGTPAIEASTYQKRGMARAATDVIEAFNLQLTEASRVANEGVGYFREAAIAHAGGSEKVREILGQWDAASIPENMYPLAGETGEQYRRRLVNGTNVFERAVQMFSRVLNKSGRGISSSTEAIREGMQRGALPSIGDIKQASITKLQEFRSLLQDIRNDIPPIGNEFRRLDTQLGQTIQRLDKELQRRRPDTARLNAGRLAQTAGAALSGAVFGGPEGFLGGVVGGIAGGPGGAFAGAAAGAQVAMLRQAAGGAAEYAAAINQQRRALRGVVDDAAAYQQSLAFIDQTSRQLAIPQEQVTRNFTRLSASVLGAGGDVAAAQEAFMGISAGIRATGGTLGDLDAALLATAQVFSKGKVSAEELRGQIGERLPGAFTLFAKSIDKTPQELDKMLEKGEVSLNDFMSFVRLMSSDFGQQALKMAASSEAAGDRLTTAMGRMQEEVGKALQPIGAEFQEMLARFTESITPVLVDVLPKIGEAALAVAKNLDVLAAALGAVVAVMAGKALLSVGSLTKAFFDLRLAIAGTNAALLLNPWVALAAGVAAVTVALVRHHTAQREFNALITSGAGTTDQMREAQAALEQRLARAKKQLENVGTGSRDAANDTKILQERVKELQLQLDKLKGTYTVRIKLESEGYTFDAAGNAATYKDAQGNIYDAVTGRMISAGKSTVEFPKGTTTESGAKGKKGREPRESRVEELNLQLQYEQGILKIIEKRQLAEKQNLELRVIDLDVQKQMASLLLQFEQTRVRLRKEVEKGGVTAAVAQAELEIEEQKLEIQLKQLQVEKASRKEAVQKQRHEDVDKIIEQSKQHLEQLRNQAAYEREYGDLIRNGTLPAVAKQYLDTKKTVEEAERALKVELERVRLLEGSQEQVARLEAALVDLTRLDFEELGKALYPERTKPISDEIVKVQGELNELTNLGNLVVNSANAIGDAFGQAFQKLVTGAASAKQVLSDFFQSVANAFFEMASQIIAKQLVMITLQAILKALGGAPGGTAAPAAPPAPNELPLAPPLAQAKGGAFSPQGHIEAYAKGGVIKAPTLFRYANGGGGFNTGLLGEAGPEAILPLRRTPDGRLGVSQVRSPQGGDTRMSEMMGRSPAQQQAPTLNLKFETTTINGVEYVSREQLEVAMAQTRRQATNDGAKRGMTMTLDKMRNSPRTRAQVGMR